MSPFVCLCFVQLDNPDEQAAQIRRELDGRLQMADQIARVRNFMDSLPGPDHCPTQEVHCQSGPSKDKAVGLAT